MEMTVEQFKALTVAFPEFDRLLQQLVASVLEWADDLPMPETDVVAAWDEYYKAVHGLESARYDEVEQWAWLRLRDRLKKIALADKKKVEPQAQP